MYIDCFLGSESFYEIRHPKPLWEKNASSLYK
jgi:hypothetical protein